MAKPRAADSMTDDLRGRLLSRIDGFLKLAEVATPGPWSEKCGILKHYVFSLDAGEDFGTSLQDLHPRDGREVPAHANAEWIAASRSFAPLVLKALREEIESHEKCGQRGPKVCSTCAISGEWPCAALRRVAASLGVEPVVEVSK